MTSKTKSWLSSRHAGALAHISSLPSDVGIGNLGQGTRDFVDFLAEAGFSHWQVCPVGPTGYGDSPYQSFSAFAGNPYFIDLQELADLDLIRRSEIRVLTELPVDRVDYGKLYDRFWQILAQAFERVEESAFQLEGSLSLLRFIDENEYWLDDYTTFMALKRRFGNRSWIEWPRQFRNPNSDINSLLSLEDRLEKSRQAFYQYVFYAQWERIKSYANAKGVQIIGDIPIYVALDSADAWKHRDVFLVDEEGRQDFVAGVPPDYFSETGQLWGNPLYNWDLLAKTGYDWWIRRIESGFQLFDILRFDHFRGFENYWVVPSDAPDASMGKWEEGPGIDFFQTIEDAIPEAKFIAEDLGYINREVFELRERTGYPGMKVMQFGYGHDDNNVNLPHFFVPNQVIYTGTHDNDTTQGWLESLEGEERQLVYDYFGLTGYPNADQIVVAALASVARLVIVPVQDLLHLPSQSRMNKPGQARGNWQWRLNGEQFNRLVEEVAPKFQALNHRYHRIDDHVQRDFSAPPLKVVDEAEGEEKLSGAAM